MIQGTGSSVGKSTIVAALGRHLARQGFSVAPFKAWNMSNNAAVCPGGGEIARAQAVQAAACGVDPRVEMNPILVKPAGSATQTIVMGRPARGYDRDVIRRAVETLAAEYDLLVVEGAGSPAEINVRDRDVANMDVAALLDAPVFLVGDIDRCGVFAQLVGTMELLRPDERERVAGFIINKYRGDMATLEPGLAELRSRYGKPVVGVIPWIDGPLLPEEDTPRDPPPGGPIRIEVVRFPRISNFTDIEPLVGEPDVGIRYVDRPSPEPPDLLILPGSKDTLADLAWLRERELDAYARRCPRVVGLCGGYQMMGGRVGDAEGLGMLDCTTTFAPEKTTARVYGTHFETSLAVEGYEIHHGRVAGGDHVFFVNGRPEGSRRGANWGTSIHGLFDNDEFRAYVLNQLRAARGLADRPPRIAPNPYDRLAELLRCHVDVDAMVAAAF